MGWDRWEFFLLKLKRIKCCPIPYRLPSGSSANLTARRGSAEFTGVGWDGLGLDGDQKGPLIFFILRYIKHYTYTNLYISKKRSRQISCGFLVGVLKSV